MLTSSLFIFEIILRCLAGLCLLGIFLVIVLNFKLPKRFFDVIAKLLLITGTVTAFCYLQETALYFFTGHGIVGPEISRYMVWNQIFGRDYFWVFWLYLFCTGGIVQILWSARNRQRLWLLGIISIVVLFSIWVSRYRLISIVLHKDF